MNEEKQNREYYQETFREVHAPQGMAERLMNMEEGKNKKKADSAAKWIAVAAVAAVVLLAGSNGIAYATTGSTWVETMVYKLTLSGVEYDVELQEINKGNGTWYEGEFQEANGDESKIIITDDGTLPIIVTAQSAELHGRDGNWYIKDGDLEIDVTDDLLEDGYASGTYERNGYTKEYRVYENDGQHSRYSYDVRTIYDGVVEDWPEQKLNHVQSVGGVAAEPTPTPTSTPIP